MLGNINSTRYSLRLRIIFGLFILLTLFVVFTMRSLPDSSLYGIKVHGIEPLISYTKLSDESRAEYQLTLLDKRRAEIERLLQKNDSVSEDAAAQIDQQITETFNAFKTAIETSESISQEETVTMLYELGLTLYIQEHLISKSGVPASIHPAAKERLAEAEDIYQAYVPLYVLSSDELELRLYINSRLQLLLREIDKEAPDEETLKKVNKRLGQIKEAIVANDASEAILLVHEALQLLKTAKYFD